VCCLWVDQNRIYDRPIVALDVSRKLCIWQESSVCCLWVDQNRIYDRILGDFPAKNTVHVPYVYDPGQPYLFGAHAGRMLICLTIHI